jgi:hypothetical protein
MVLLAEKSPRSQRKRTRPRLFRNSRDVGGFVPIEKTTPGSVTPITYLGARDQKRSFALSLPGSAGKPQQTSLILSEKVL